MVLELALRRGSDKEARLGTPTSFVIINRRAKRLRTPSELLREQCRARATSRVFETESLDDLEAATRDVARVTEGAAGPTTVVLAGGDGAYMAGVSALCRAFDGRALPRIALAPGGTVSTVAKNWSPPLFRGSLHYSRRLLDAIAEGTVRVTRRPTLLVRATPPARDGAPSSGRDTERIVRVGFIFGAGLVANFFRIYEQGGAGGTSQAARIVARVFAESFVGGEYARRVLDPIRSDVTVDGLRAPFDQISLLCASVVRDLGLGMQLTYRAAEQETRFHLVATPLSTSRLGPQMPLVLMGKALAGEKVDALAGHVNLSFPNGGDYVLDGDLFQASTVEVTAGPVLEVVTPG